MKINPLNSNFFSKKIDNSFNIFFIFGNNYGLIDLCYSKLTKNLQIDLDNPFNTNYFDENRLLNNTVSFFDELNSISLFGKQKTIVVDLRQSDKKNEIIKIFKDFNFSEIKNIKIVIIGYFFKQSDILSNKILNSENAICFTCYEVDEYNIKKDLKRELPKININLNQAQISELTSKFSKDSKIIQNTFEKIQLQNNKEKLTFNQLMHLIDDSVDKNVLEMINKLITRNYKEAFSLLENFEQNNTSSSYILHMIKSRLKLLKKCLIMKKDGYEKNEIVRNKSLNIFYKEYTFFLKMLDIWNLNKINECLFYVCKTELSCRSYKNYEYILLGHLFLYIYFKIKI